MGFQKFQPLKKNYAVLVCRRNPSVVKHIFNLRSKQGEKRKHRNIPESHFVETCLVSLWTVSIHCLCWTEETHLQVKWLRNAVITWYSCEICTRFIVSVGLLERRHETEELINMNDVDVIDLQADGSAVNLSGTWLLWCLGPVRTGRGAPCRRHCTQMGHIVVNGSVHTACM